MVRSDIHVVNGKQAFGAVLQQRVVPAGRAHADLGANTRAMDAASRTHRVAAGDAVALVTGLADACVVEIVVRVRKGVACRVRVADVDRGAFVARIALPALVTLAHIRCRARSLETPTRAHG